MIEMLSLMAAPLRPPSVPLVTHDPYFSIWSAADRLTDDTTRHWTGAEHPLVNLIRIDGKTYRLMGKQPESTPALEQKSLDVWPTRTVYTFAGAGTEVELTFTSPLLPDDIDVLSRPVTYISWNLKSTDGKNHEASIYFEASARIAVNAPNQTVDWSADTLDKATRLRIGSTEQPVLGKRGDNLRIDWGHLYLVGAGKGFLGNGADAREAFVAGQTLPAGSGAKSAPAENISAALVLPTIEFGSKAASSRLTIAYDDEYSIQYFRRNLKPYWRRNGMDADGLLRAAEKDYAKLAKRCETFDREVVADLEKAGGPSYAQLGSLAYRQAIAAQKVVADLNGQPLMFSKENFSNGCIGTVDVLYPAAPQLLLFSPALAKASLAPILEYAASPRWKWPFAPHDLGQYPMANGQVYGGGERTEENQMPVEESGNMIILLAALAKIEGNADFSKQYWPQLEKWAKYLLDKGLDPESQLSTDDFAGHLAHNVNLSAKAIVALASYATLAETLGEKAEAEKYRAIAKDYAKQWVEKADDGDHFRLAFDKQGTWSQKYNIVWDRLLGFDLFPGVAQKEMAYYSTKQNRFGLPLDNRKDYTKLDWIVWTATTTGDRKDFEALIDPIIRFLNETTDRVPMTDWYYTSEPRQSGFQARSVVGGVFIKLLENKAVWTKYAKRDKTPVGPWSKVPPPPVVTTVVAPGAKEPVEWAYTFDKPAENWFAPSFDASSWKKGQSGFGSGETPGGTVRTEWTSTDIWLRRDYELPADALADLHLWIQHDDDAEIYVNGVLAASLPWANRYEPIALSPAAKKALKPGRNSIAIHCKDTGGHQYIDIGFVTVREAK